MESQKLRASIKDAHADQDVRTVAFAPNGMSFASGGEDNLIKLWDATTAKEKSVLAGHTSWVLSVAFSPDGKRLVSGGSDKSVRIWNVAGASEHLILNGHTGVVDTVAFHPGGKIVASGSQDNAVKLWDAQTGNLIATLTAHRSIVTVVAFSPDGKLLATGGLDYNVRLWDVATHAEVLTLKGHKNPIEAIAFAQNGKVIASSAVEENQIKLWDPKTGQMIKTVITTQDTPALACAGNVLASGAEPDSTLLWDIEKGTKIGILKGHPSSVQSLAFSSDGKLLLSASYGLIQLWEISEKK